MFPDKLFPALVLLAIGGLIGLTYVIAWLFERKRRDTLRVFGDRRGMAFSLNGEIHALADPSLPLFQRGKRRRVFNVLRRETSDGHLVVFDYCYVTGGGKSSNHAKQTVLAFRSSRLQLPVFEIVPEGFITRALEKLGYADIDFPSDPDFSQKFRLTGTDEAAIRKFFTPERLRILRDFGNAYFQGSGSHFLLYRRPHRLKVEELEKVILDAERIFDCFRRV